MNLTAGEKTFTGKSEINFQLKNNSEPLRIDFYLGAVTNLTINGKSVTPDKKKYWIDLPAAELKGRRQHGRCRMIKEYSHQGQGLHRFTDPKPKRFLSIPSLKLTMPIALCLALINPTYAPLLI